jgi:hypothetical protein
MSFDGAERHDLVAGLREGAVAAPGDVVVVDLVVQADDEHVLPVGVLGGGDAEVLDRAGPQQVVADGGVAARAVQHGVPDLVVHADRVEHRVDRHAVAHAGDDVNGLDRARQGEVVAGLVAARPGDVVDVDLAVQADDEHVAGVRLRVPVGGGRHRTALQGFHAGVDRRVAVGQMVVEPVGEDRYGRLLCPEGDLWGKSVRGQWFPRSNLPSEPTDNRAIRVPGKRREMRQKGDLGENPKTRKGLVNRHFRQRTGAGSARAGRSAEGVMAPAVRVCRSRHRRRRPLYRASTPPARTRQHLFGEGGPPRGTLRARWLQILGEQRQDSSRSTG